MNDYHHVAYRSFMKKEYFTMDELKEPRITLRCLEIKNVHHLHDINLALDSANGLPRHLVLTGKNGSGKTSVLKAISSHLEEVCSNDNFSKNIQALQVLNHQSKDLSIVNDEKRMRDTNQVMESLRTSVEKARHGIELVFNVPYYQVFDSFQNGSLVIAFFQDNRKFETLPVKHIEKVPLQDHYKISEEPRKDFIRYLVDKKVSQSLYQTENDTANAVQIKEWFDSFERLLREVFEDESLSLKFDVKTFSFSLLSGNRDPFDFNTMSAGYSAILDITISMIMRMEANANGKFAFDLPGIVLIDEPETHLHYELQKKIMPFLCRIFPNVQFIVATHSAFVLNSMENVVIYDLENQTLVENGLANVPYEGIIKSYFDVSTLSHSLSQKFERYKELVTKETLTDEDFAEIGRLQIYLEEIPDYLALDLSLEYRQLKLELQNREDLK